MSGWEDYPAGYRSVEVNAVLAALRAGECVSIVGLSGAGKSNLMGFLANRCGGEMRLVDCNRLAEVGQPARLYELIGETLGETEPAGGLRALERLVEAGLRQGPGLYLLFDRFDALNDPARETAGSGLRALRDRFKYKLAYVTATRRPPSAGGELAELFYANTLWLGPLARADALWSAGQYARRRGLDWDQARLERLVELSGGYPSFLRAACEAHAAGCGLEADALCAHPVVRRRLDEFWSDQPRAEELRLAGLAGHPWLAQAMPPERIDPVELTASEQRLLEYLRGRAGQVCAKDDLIAAVWPEEAVSAGLRDDSLAQLVHRLREKIGARWVQTVPGRGYRFQG